MIDPPAPFALGDGPDACLLLHGLTGAPSEVRPLGEALARAGLRAVGPLLPGHGTRAADLGGFGRRDLIAAATRALAELQGARRIFVAGLSAGALLALHLASVGRMRIDRLALLAPAIRFTGATWAFTQVVGRLPARLPFVVSKGRRDIQGAAVPVPEGAADERNADGSYRSIPLRWGRELRLLSQDALELASAVRAPTLILHGALDATTAVAGARLLAGSLGSSEVCLQVFPRSGHVLPLDLEADAVCARIVRFFQEE